MDSGLAGTRSQACAGCVNLPALPAPRNDESEFTRLGLNRLKHARGRWLHRARTAGQSHFSDYWFLGTHAVFGRRIAVGAPRSMRAWLRMIARLTRTRSRRDSSR